MARAAAGLGWLAAAAAQQVGPLTQEGAVNMAIEACVAGGSCSPESTRVVMDMNWRWLHGKSGYDNCLKDKWDAGLCPDPATCAENCALEGVTTEGYTNDYKVTPIEKGIRLDYPKAPRVYLLENEDRYKLFKLKNKEFTFDVDLSTLPCGMNAALYFIEMPPDGDKGTTNAAGPRYGTGYCDAQCPRMKFIQGKANSEGWKKRPALNPELEEVMIGPEGRYGYCCAEMDILEANREAGAYTAHPCKHEAAAVCDSKEECGDKREGLTGWCDKDGCGFSSFRMGDGGFWGAGNDYKVDTSRPMTIVTQFITSDGTDYGDLVDIRRLYIQDGRVIQNSEASALKSGGRSMTDSLCREANKEFNATSNGFSELGGLKAMGEALGRGMTLSMSIWDDNLGRMLWLDGERASVDEDVKDPGVRRGPCPFKYGDDKDERDNLAAEGPVFVTFSNVRYGDIDSTYAGGAQAPAGLRLYSTRHSVAAPSEAGAPRLPTLGAVAAAAAAVAALAALALGRRRRAAALEDLVEEGVPLSESLE